MLEEIKCSSCLDGFKTITKVSESMLSDEEIDEVTGGGKLCEEWKGVKVCINDCR